MAILPDSMLPTRHEKRAAEPIKVHPESPKRGSEPLTKKEVLELAEGMAEFPQGRVIASMSSTVYPNGTPYREMVEGWLRFQTLAIMTEILDLLRNSKKK